MREIDSTDIEGTYLDPDIVLPTYFAFVDWTRELLMKRMEKRLAHLTKRAMLNGQLNTPEWPEKPCRGGRCNCGAAT